MMVRPFSYTFLLSFSVFYLGYYTLADCEKNLLNDDIWKAKQTTRHEFDLNQTSGDFENENQIPEVEENDGRRQRSNVLTYDRSTNLTEKDKGPNNDTKLIVINSEDRLTIYENDDEDESNIQDRDKQRFSLLTPEGFLSRIHSSEENGLERTKRQAQGGKRRCRCRRRGRRRGMRRRRRRRRRRGGQSTPARRRRRGRRRGAGRRRRGRRRCVCRRKEGGGGEGEGEEDGKGGGEGEEGKKEDEGEGDEEEGKGEEEEDEGEGDDEGDGEGEGDEEGGGDDEGKDGDEDEDGDEGGELEEEDEDEGSEEENGSNDESDEKSDKKSEEESDEKKKEMWSKKHGRDGVVYVVSYPEGSRTHEGVLTYSALPVPFSPYPYYTGSQSGMTVKELNLPKT